MFEGQTYAAKQVKFDGTSSSISTSENLAWLESELLRSDQLAVMYAEFCALVKRKTQGQAGIQVFRTSCYRISRRLLGLTCALSSVHRATSLYGH